MSKAQFFLDPYKYDAMMLLCGNLDENIHAIENYFDVEIRYHADEFEITSDSSANNTQAKRFIKSYYAEILAGNTEFDLEQITTILNAAAKDKATATAKSRKKVEEAEVQLRSKKLKARTHNQAIYLENIKNNFVTFGIGHAGTGKTYIAIACAVAAHEKGEVRRIVLIQPAVEAGEKLGFLPGDLTQIDLPKNVTSGLSHALSILNDIEGVAISYLKSVDIVHQSSSRKIVNAYDKHE